MTQPKDAKPAAPAIFPKSVRLGRFGKARLVRVEHVDRGPVGLYAVEPGDVVRFGESVAMLRGHLNLTYQPISALWGSWRLPEKDDDLLFQVGLEVEAGRARARAFRALKPKATSLVSEAEVKALALGYLQRVGAEV